jgi:hypothetical protein
MNCRFKHILLTVSAGLFICPAMFAAPMPATGTSALTNPKLGIYTSPLGFRMSAADTNWLLSEPPPKTKYIVTMYKAPEKFQNTQPSLTVRVDTLKEKQSLKDYVSQWIKDYPKFGFDVLNAKGEPLAFKVGDQVGYLVDLSAKEAPKQLRQVVFMKDNNAVILTCRDHKDNFKNTLKACNSIIRTFAWDEKKP